jgi:glutamate racemase
LTVIGVFDSGVGGLTVVRGIMEQLPGYDVLYFGDTARTPYGSKSAATVIKYAVENTEWLISQGAQAVVLACNTASSVATEILRRRFAVPFFEVISPAVNQAIQVSRSGCIGIIGTRATIASGVYETLIREGRPEFRVYACACPLLVPLVEEGWFAKPETARIVKNYLRPLKTRQIDTLILGCTHYPMLGDLIQSKIGRRVRVIDSSSGVVSSILALIKQNPVWGSHLKHEGNYRFVVSDTTDQFETIARAIIKRPIRLETLPG